MLDFIHHVDIVQITKMAGYIGLTAIIFMETGLFIGFFLPGDSLLFTAGLLSGQGFFNIYLLVFLLIVAAILGYWVAYWLGSQLGHWLMKREDSFWFKKKYIIQAHEFYEKHGGKALIIGRLMPVIRTFVPIVAGMAGMSQRRYAFYNVVGSLVWCGGVTLAGFFLGSIIPDASHYILPIAILIIVVSLLPGLIHLVRSKYKPSVRKL